MCPKGYMDASGAGLCRYVAVAIMREVGDTAIERGDTGADEREVAAAAPIGREAGGLGMYRGIDAGLALCRRAGDVLACVRIMLLTVDCK